MSNVKTSKNVICALLEQGGVGIKVNDASVKYVRFTLLKDGNIAVCYNNRPELIRVSKDKFVEMAEALNGKIEGMHP